LEKEKRGTPTATGRVFSDGPAGEKRMDPISPSLLQYEKKKEGKKTRCLFLQKNGKKKGNRFAVGIFLIGR